MRNLPPGCKAFTVARSINGETVTLSIIAPSKARACLIADERAAQMRNVR